MLTKHTKDIQIFNNEAFNFVESLLTHEVDAIVVQNVLKKNGYVVYLEDSKLTINDNCNSDTNDDGKTIMIIMIMVIQRKNLVYQLMKLHHLTTYLIFI